MSEGIGQPIVKAWDFADQLKKVRDDEGMQWVGAVAVSGSSDDLQEATDLISDLEALGERAKDLGARVAEQA